jgi:ankyrin repeat protein
MWAAQNGETSAAKILLEYGANLNAQNNDGETALHSGCQGGYQEVVQILLNKHADRNILDNNGKTPLDLAKKKLNQDPENGNLKRIKDLLLSVK